MAEEIWKDVVGFEGLYKISNDGLIMSLSFKRSGISKILKPRTQPEGYKKICLRKNNHTYAFFVHRLMMEAFYYKSSFFVDHINGDRADNRIENLRYCTNRQNMSFDNVKRKIKKSSQYTGVAWDRHAKKWKSSITIKRKSFHLGNYDDEKLAHEAYLNRLNSLHPTLL